MKAASDTTNAINQGLAFGFHGKAAEAVALTAYFRDRRAAAYLRNDAFRFYYSGNNAVAKTKTARTNIIGRPRSEKTRKAILRAAFRLLTNQGFDGVANQQIAKEAGVSTATLYRWWENKHAILLDAYLETTRELLPYGKQGSPLGRLRAYTIRLGQFLKSEEGRVFLRLMLAIQDNPPLRKAFYQRVFLPRRAEGRAVVQEAMKAGELPTTVDPDFLIDLLIGPQILPALFGQHTSAKAAGRIFDFALKAALG
jgi:AcrR family transcriptional regulator